MVLLIGVLFSRMCVLDNSSSGDACLDSQRALQITQMLLFDDDKIKVARKPGKKQKENPVGCTGEGKR